MTDYAFETQFTRHFGGAAPGATRAAAVRQGALERFNALGFPTRKQEHYKYTDLKPLAEGAFDLVPSAPSEAECAAAAKRIEAAGLNLDGPRVVFVDGHYVAELSQLDAGLPLETGPLSEDWERANGGGVPRRGTAAPDGGAPENPNGSQSGGSQSRTVSRYGNEPGGLADSALAALNTAFMQHGIYVRVPKGARVEAPVQLIFAGSGTEGLAPQPRVLLDLGANAELTVVQHFVDAGDAAAWTNLVTEVRQDAGSRLTLYRLQEHGAGQYHTGLLDAHLGRDAHLTASYVDLGGKLVRNDIDVTLDEPGAEADLSGLIFAGGGRHVDDHLYVNHRAAHTRSRQAFRAIVGSKGRGVFNGKVAVQQGAQQIDAQQSSDNLLLARDAEIDTKPELEIYADDVKCSHGATVGELDEEQLFYLRARGIDEDVARGLLVFAFANHLLERIALPSLRAHVAERVAESLPHDRRWETLA